MYQHPRTIAKKIRKIFCPAVRISLFLSDFSGEVSKQTNWQTYKWFIIIWEKCTNIPGMSPKNFRKLSYPELEISQYLCNFCKKVSQSTHWQTYKKFRIIWNMCTNILGMSPKKFRKISCTEMEISWYLCNFSKKVGQLIEWKTCQKLYIMQNLIYHYICLFSVKKEDNCHQTYKKFRIIWN